MKDLKQEVKDISARYLAAEGNSFVNDLRQHGCVSGMVSELICYKDTLAFYARHKEAINELLVNLLEECGIASLKDVFGTEWDDFDPLVLEQQNQNLLVWYAFETTVLDLYDN